MNWVGKLVWMGWLCSCGGGPLWAAAPQPASRPTSRPVSRPVRSARISARGKNVLAMLKARAAAFFRKRKLPGLSMAVVLNGRLVRTFHWGVRDRKTGAQPGDTTLYRVGSVSKVFTAMLAVALREQGKLRLDDAVQAYLPQGAKGPPPLPGGASVMRLRHLLTHTSGLPSLPFNLQTSASDPYNNYSAALMLKALPRLALQTPIGHHYAYSNLGYALLGYVLTRAGGRTYEELLQRDLLQPLHMADTSSQPKSATLRGLPQAVGYTKADPTKEATPWTLGVFVAAGGILSSVRDLARFLVFHLRAGRPGVSPLSGGTLHEMQTIQRTLGWFQGSYFKGGIGLGWHILSMHDGKDRLIFHNGGLAGFRSFVGFSPLARAGVVLLTNCGRSVDPLGFAAVKLLSQHLAPSPSRPINPLLRGVVRRLTSHIVPKPSEQMKALFRPSFLQKVPLSSLRGLLARMHRNRGAVTNVRYEATHSPNVTIATLRFLDKSSLRVLVGIDSQRPPRIGVLYFLPTGQRKASTRRTTPRPQASTQPRQRPRRPATRPASNPTRKPAPR